MTKELEEFKNQESMLIFALALKETSNAITIVFKF